ncbi:MAG: RagB/SusD family nutrient uptake outer membrane protein [Bacteroides cellulosilyticus]
MPIPHPTKPSIERSTYDECIDYICSDMEKAAEFLPDSPYTTIPVYCKQRCSISGNLSLTPLCGKPMV